MSRFLIDRRLQGFVIYDNYQAKNILTKICVTQKLPIHLGNLKVTHYGSKH